ERAARLEATLRAPELDADSMADLARSALAGLGLERPGEIALDIDVGHARIGGADARNIAARLSFGSDGIAIERFSIESLAKASLMATGSIRTRSAAGSKVTAYLDARDLDGVVALADKYAPAIAGPLRGLAARQKTAVLQA